MKTSIICLTTFEFRSIHKNGGEMQDHAETMRLMYNTSIGSTLSNIDNYTVMIFTGKMDKSGKKIFVGDVVRYNMALLESGDTYEFFIGVVIFENEFHGGFLILRSCGREDKLTIPDNIEVIGNIYHNPALMGTTAKKASKTKKGTRG